MTQDGVEMKVVDVRKSYEAIGTAMLHGWRWEYTDVWGIACIRLRRGGLEYRCVVIDGVVHYIGRYAAGR